MMSLKMLLLTLIATTALLLGSGVAFCQPMNEIEYLKYSDLVVRGTIVDYSMEEPTRAEWFGAGTLKPDWPYPITVLDLNAVEIIRGSWNGSEMQVIAEGGWPGTILDARPSWNRSNHTTALEQVLSWTHKKG